MIASLILPKAQSARARDETDEKAAIGNGDETDEKAAIGNDDETDEKAAIQ